MINLEIEAYISKKRKIWIGAIILGWISLLAFSLVSFLYYWNEANKAKELVFAPPIDPLQIIQQNFLLVLVIPIIGSIIVYFGGQYGYVTQISEPIADLFQIYNIEQVKSLTGRIDITDNVYLEITWSNPKKRFIIKEDSNIIAYAKPSNLFWKTLYLIHKYSGE